MHYKKRKMNPILKARYLASTWQELVHRVMTGPIWQGFKQIPPTIKEFQTLEWALSNQVFIPAGNTLTFSANKLKSGLTQKLRPNCSILSGVCEKTATGIWDNGIGIGTTISHPEQNPVEHLLRLQDAWDKRQVTHRPKRGNMYVYPAGGKYIEEFIRVKSTTKDADRIPGFNISVSFDDFEKQSHVVKMIAESAWNTGDPGVVFMDRVNKQMPFIHKGKKIRTMVPCGEQGMFDGETCTLGSINLNADELRRDYSNEIDFSKLESAVRIATRFLDNAVTVASVEDQNLQADYYRRIGLGVMGWADLLKKLDLEYASDDAHDYAERLSRFVGAIARHESMMLAQTRGTFPAWYKENMHINFDFERKDTETLREHSYHHYANQVERRRQKIAMRNVTVTCIAPTGGISLLTGNKGFAVEPEFGDFIDWKHQLSVTNAWQDGMCNSVSKTVNFQSTATVQDFENAILYAWKLPNIKALSLYRDGSRTSQPM